MKKRYFLVLILALAAILCLAGCAAKEPAAQTPAAQTPADQTPAVQTPAADDTVYQFRAASMLTSTDALYGSFEHLCDILEERSNGRIKTEFFGNKALCSNVEETTDIVINGVVECVCIDPAAFANISPQLNYFGMFETPFLFLNEDEIMAFCKGDVYQECIRKAAEVTGLKVYDPLFVGWIGLGSVKPCFTLDEVSKLKLRTHNLSTYIAAYSSFGCTVTPLAYSEIYTSLQQGLVDSAISCTPLWVSDGFYELIKYYSTLYPNGAIYHPLVNKTWYESLPADLQGVFDECMADFVAYATDAYHDAEDAAIKTMKDSGVEILTYTDEERKPFIEAAKTSWPTIAKDMGGMEVLQSYVDWTENYRANK